MLEILEGAIVTGKSGKPLRVISINGDGLVLESDTGLVKAKRSAIVTVISPALAKVEPPPEATAPLAVGDTAYYCGDRYWHQYRDMPLVLFELREGLWICEKPDGYRTTNIPPIELSRSPVEKPAKNSTANQPRKGQWLKDWEKENQPMQE
jgi:hypothetical protein